MPVKIEKIPMTKMAKENEKLWKVDYEKVEKVAVTAVTAVELAAVESCKTPFYRPRLRVRCLRY